MKKHWLGLVALLLIAYVLRVYRLDAVSLRGDEAFTVVFVQRTWEGLWKGISTIEPNPPLMYLLLRGWVAVAGTSEWATRYFSVFFGVLCVPLIYRLARELFRGTAAAATIGLIGAALLAVNPYQIWHSQDVRNYTMWPALSLLALVFFWKWWEGEKLKAQSSKLEAKSSNPNNEISNSKSQFALSHFAFRITNDQLALFCYVIATLASLYTHYYDTFILVAENVFVFAFALLGHRRRALVRWIGAQIVIAAAYVPWVLFGTNRITTYGEASGAQSVPLIDQFSRTLATLVLSDTVPNSLKTFLWLPLAIGLVVVLACLAMTKQGRERAIFLTLYIVIPTFALYAISIGRPLFLERYLNGIAPAYYMVFAIGLAMARYWKVDIGRWRMEKAASSFQLLASNIPLAISILPFFALAAFALSNYYFDPAYAKAPDWRGLSRVIAGLQEPGDIIVQNFNEMAVTYYASGTLPVVTVPKDFWAAPADEKTLERLNKDYSRIWFIPSSNESWDPSHFVERYLSRHGERLRDAEVGGLSVQLYATPRQFLASLNPTGARVGQATLVGYRLADLDASPNSFRTGSRLVLFLYWRPVEKTDRNLTVFVHIVAADGKVVAQRDSVPVNGTWATPDWLPGELIVDTYNLTLDVAPGEYKLVAGMYDPTTLARAPALDVTGAPLADNSVPLTRITVIP